MDWHHLSTNTSTNSLRFHTQRHPYRGHLEFRKQKCSDWSCKFHLITNSLFFFFDALSLFFLFVCVCVTKGFANPANMSFTYPATTGMSYSLCVFFFFALYTMRLDCFYFIYLVQTMGSTRFHGIGSLAMVCEISNSLVFLSFNFPPPGSDPTCITGVVVWVHGTYTLNPNGSITATPFGDGYQQVQDPCAAVSNFIQLYNDTELYQSWRIFLDPQSGPHLNLYEFDNSPLPPMFQITTSPMMLPTRLLRNVTVAASKPSKRSLSVSGAESLLGPQWTLGVVTAAAVVLMATVTTML